MTWKSALTLNYYYYYYFIFYEELITHNYCKETFTCNTVIKFCNGWNVRKSWINLFSSFIHNLHTVLLKIVNTVCPLIQFLCANVRGIHVQCIHVLVADKKLLNILCTWEKELWVHYLYYVPIIIHCMPKILNHGLSSPWDLYM